MRKRTLLVVFVLVGILCGCSKKTYELSGKIQGIECIEIFYVFTNSSYTIEELLNIEPDTVISSENFSSFLDELLALPCTPGFLDPSQGFDGYTIRIYYNDGSWELICYVLGLYYYDMQRFEWKHLRFEQDVFNAFIQKYI